MTDDNDEAIEAMVNEALADPRENDPDYGMPLPIPFGSGVPPWAFTPDHIDGIIGLCDRFAETRSRGFPWRTTIQGFGKHEVGTASMTFTGEEATDGLQMATAALLVRQVHPEFTVLVGDALLVHEGEEGMIETRGSFDFDSKEAKDGTRAAWVTYLVRQEEGCAMFVLYQPYMLMSDGAVIWDDEAQQWQLAMPETTNSRVLEAVVGSLSWGLPDPHHEAMLDHLAEAAMARPPESIGITYTVSPR